jgi:hypothetical protein
VQARTQHAKLDTGQPANQVMYRAAEEDEQMTLSWPQGRGERLAHS